MNTRMKELYLRRAIRRKPRKRLPRPLHPDLLIDRYDRELNAILRFVKGRIDAKIKPLLPKLAAHYARERKDADDLDTLAAELESVRIEVSQEFSKEEIRKLARLTGESVADWNAKQMNKQFGGIVEIDLFGAGGEPWLAREMGAFVAQNVDLISSIPEDYLSQVSKLIATAIRGGTRVEEIASEIDDRFEVGESRARLIARDQIGKFNGQLAEARQKDLGIDGYIWRGVGDARERDSHRQNNDKRFTWDDPPATGHPGEDYQCRCWAEPDLAKLYDDEHN